MVEPYSGIVVSIEKKTTDKYNNMPGLKNKTLNERSELKEEYTL